MKAIKLIYLVLAGISINPVWSQVSFTKINDTVNAISTHPPVSSYTGASWIDYNGDGLIDLFVNPNFLYKNQGNGGFTIETLPGLNQVTGLANGNSWGDFDNDGDPDLARTHSLSDILENRDSLFLNETSGRMGTTVFRGWSCSWGDYDNDGFLDIVLVHPQGFLGAAQKNIMFHNNGDGRFSRVFNDVTNLFSAYTGCNWTDFDLDGDLDLFIGSGEVSNLSTDDIFINTLSQSGVANLIRLDTGALATDLRDGQNWNWIDFDNDGDLDGFVTNYFGSKTNDLYRNDGNGIYTRLNSLQAGSIVSQQGAGLTNLWGDFDNDGDLDCFVTFDGGQQDRFYRNDFAYFNEVTLALSQNGNSRGASAGDFDNDGFLDIFVSSASASSVGLYKNDGNSNHWIILDLEGMVSNRSAIGAKVRLSANIGGSDIWQIREVNAQNSFCGANDLRQHFGLAQANQADTIIIYWPSGQIDSLFNISSDTILNIRERIPQGYLRANFSADVLEGEDSLLVSFSNLSIYDPNDSIQTYEWDFNNDGTMEASSKNPQHLFMASANPFSVKLVIRNASGDSDTILREDYITVNPGTTAIEKVNVQNPMDLIFPNPISNRFKLRYVRNVQKIVIRDLTGKIVHEWLTPSGNREYVLPKIDEGIYIFEIFAEGYVQRQKIMIEHL